MSEPQNPSVFSFEAQTGQEAVLEIAQRNMPATASDGQLRLAMEASGLATYHWNIDSDEIVWSANAIEVLGSDPVVVIDCGKDIILGGDQGNDLFARHRSQ